jgi:hypothetical protein
MPHEEQFAFSERPVEHHYRRHRGSRRGFRSSPPSESLPRRFRSVPQGRARRVPHRSRPVARRNTANHTRVIPALASTHTARAFAAGLEQSSKLHTPSRSRDGCIGSRRCAVALTGEDRGPPPAATAAPVVRRRPRGARARPDTSNWRGLPRRRCRQRRSRRVDRLMCSRVLRRCTCRSLTTIHAR